MPTALPTAALLVPSFPRHLNDMQDYGHLSYASSLCGNCTEVCPVRINIHEMLLENRHIYVEDKYGGIKEKMAWRMFRHGVMHRQLMNTANGKIKNFVFEKAFRTAWGERRTQLVFPPKSFNQLWKDRNKRK